MCTWPPLELLLRIVVEGTLSSTAGSGGSQIAKSTPSICKSHLSIGCRVTNDASGAYIGLMSVLSCLPFYSPLPFNISSTSHSYAPSPLILFFYVTPMPMPLLMHIYTMHLCIRPMICYTVAYSHSTKDNGVYYNLSSR